jgi:6-phosphogluconolactonase
VSHHIADAFFELLNPVGQEMEVPWHNVHLFWVDQCCESPRKQTRRPAVTCAFARRVNLPATNVHEICTGCRSCESFALTYEETIKRVVGRGQPGVPSFDLILLHMTADGRIASLFPDTYGFYETQRLVWVSRVIGAGLTYTALTHPLLQAARQVVVSVSGLESALTLREALIAEPDVVQYPVHALWPILDRITWLVDESAAAFLPLPLASRAT